MMMRQQQQQVGGRFWPDFTESEDHIVPHPMETEEENLSSVEEYNKDRKITTVDTDVRFTEQSSQAKNDHVGYKSTSSSNFQMNEELSSPRIELDSWDDFPSLCDELRDDRADGNDLNSVMTNVVTDLTGTTDMNTMGGGSMQLDHEPDLFANNNKGSSDFVDCDWSTFGDFDDIETLFSNDDSIFGHHIGDEEGFLSSSKDVIDSSAQPIPIPDLPLSKDQEFDEGCVSFHVGDQSEKQRSPLQKEKVDGQKIISTAQNKAVERKKNKPSKNLKDNSYQNYSQNQNGSSRQFPSSVAPPLRTFQSKEISQQMQLSDANPIEHLGSSSQVTFSGHGYPAYCFYGIPLPSQVHIDRNPSFNSTTSKRQDEKPVSMTPQEKMEKLRRLQQMQAQLAIEQQQQQYASVSKSPPLSSVRIDDSEQNVPSSLLEMLTEHDESIKSSSLRYDPSMQETVYYQLQDVVGKLDTRIRLCIRDSLLRLAKSAMNRQNVSDKNSTTKCNKDQDEVSANQESIMKDRPTWVADSETDTNSIDRMVAGLLFHRQPGGPRLEAYKLLDQPRNVM